MTTVCLLVHRQIKNWDVWWGCDQKLRMPQLTKKFNWWRTEGMHIKNWHVKIQMPVTGKPKGRIKIRLNFAVNSSLGTDCFSTFIHFLYNVHFPPLLRHSNRIFFCIQYSAIYRGSTFCKVILVKQDSCQTTPTSVFWANLVGHPFRIDILTANWGKAVARLVAVNTDDLVQPSRQTDHSDPDLSYTTLAARTGVYKCLFFYKNTW